MNILLTSVWDGEGRCMTQASFRTQACSESCNRDFFSRQEDTIRDVEMPVVILGDPVYPLIPWFMKAYPGHLNSSKEHFNYRLIGAE